jgi:hypothetical protein
MKQWQTWIVKLFRLKGTLDTERALRSTAKREYERGYKNGVADGVKIQQQFIPAVYIDQAGQKQAQAQVAAYEPEKHTDPFAEIHQRLRHRRALMRYNTRSLARQLDDPDATRYEIPAFLKDQASP